MEERLKTIEKSRDSEVIRLNKLSLDDSSRQAVQDNINSIQANINTIQTEMKELYEKRQWGLVTGLKLEESSLKTDDAIA